MEKQNEQHGDAADLSQWLEEAEEPNKKPPVEPIQKKTSETLVEKIEKEQNIFTPPKPNNVNSNLYNQQPPPATTLTNIKNDSSQISNNKEVKKTKRKKRHSLNYKNRKTLRQAFVLNTVLSKAKAYEP